MSFEDRVRSAVDQALSTLVKQVVDEAADERDATTAEAIAAAAPGGRPGF